MMMNRCSSFLAKAMQPPEEVSIASACDLLYRMDAFDTNEDLTPLGRHLACLPMDPRLGKMLLMGVVFKCLDPSMITQSPWVL
jgi:HrpA-like RNA helicase